VWRVPPPLRVRGGNGAGGNTNVPELYNVYWLETVLTEAGYSSVKRFSWAPSPMVKFRGPNEESRSVTVNDLGGVYAAQIIQAYCELSPYVLRPLIHVLRRWIKAHGLNVENGKTMAAHCITLTAIAYLQHIGALPNLQAGVKARSYIDARDQSLEDTVWVHWRADQGIPNHIAFSRRPPPGWSPRTMSAAEAVRGYFKFMAAFDYRTRFLSILHGGVVRRRFFPGSEYTVNAADPAFKYWWGYPGAEYVGKCDVWQPELWDPQGFIVQDPFQWQKVG
jgi:hypothetical protein